MARGRDSADSAFCHSFLHVHDAESKAKLFDWDGDDFSSGGTTDNN